MEGRVRIEGSKNAALPIVAASCLIPGDIRLRNVPNIRDIRDQFRLMNEAGWHSRVFGDEVRLTLGHQMPTALPRSILLRMRGSIYALVVHLIRSGYINFPGVGGDVIAGRSLEPHIRAFAGLGFSVSQSREGIKISGENPRCGEFRLDDKIAGVTASATALMLSAVAEGRSVIHGVSREPEVLEVARFLKACNAKISWDKSTAIVEGPITTKPSSWALPTDRVVWGTFAAAIAATGGRGVLPTLKTDEAESIVSVFDDCGVSVSHDADGVTVSGRPTRPLRLETGIFPRFPSDLAPQMTALMAVAPGTSTLIENVYPHRFDHIRQLVRSGLNAVVDGPKVSVLGGSLQPGVWSGSGIRESASLLLCGLLPRGPSRLQQISSIARGYENLVERLVQLGGQIEIIDEGAPTA